MKTFHSRRDVRPEQSALSSDPEFCEDGALAPSGFHRVRKHAAPDNLPPRGSRMRALLRAWAPNLLFALPACHWLVHHELSAVVLALCPLLFIAFERGTMSSYVRAGLCSVMISAADVVHPFNSSTAFAEPSLHRMVFLAVMLFVVLRLRDAYYGLKELSRRDPLTGLLNRRGFEELAQRELERAARYKRPIAFALVDIDRFKEINDRFGHLRGDRVLSAVGSELARLRASDFAVRLGGDEFGLLMPETDRAAASRVLARLKLRVEERTRSEGCAVTISVGIATREPATGTLDSLLAEADRRMYLEKPAARSLRAAGQRWQGYDAPSR